MQIRRVVTGHDTSGRSVFVADAEVPAFEPAIMPGASFHRLWGFDDAPTFPGDGSQPSGTAYFPAPGGVRFGFFTLAPANSPGPDTSVDVAAGMAAFEAAMPGLLSHMEPDVPGMHTTDTVDFEVIITGTVVLELDDGASVTLHPGDTVVQNGTRHRWSNPGEVPALIAVFLTGAHRSAPVA